MRRAILALGISLMVVTGAATAGEFQRGNPPASKGKPATDRPQRPVGTTGRPSSVQQTLQRTPGLADRIGERLPAKIDVMWAAEGFRNLGQFVAAVNASNNLDIPFVTLKSRMLDRGMTLGQAIRNLRPSADYRKEARRAEGEAQAIIRGR